MKIFLETAPIEAVNSAMSWSSPRVVRGAHAATRRAGQGDEAARACASTCPPLCAEALWPMPAWVWRDVRSVFILFYSSTGSALMHPWLGRPYPCPPGCSSNCEGRAGVSCAMHTSTINGRPRGKRKMSLHC